MSDQPPEGFRYEWTPEPVEHWRVVDDFEGHERRCRWGAGYKSKSCGRVSVAALLRSGRSPLGVWWHYCERHLYGRRIEGDVVLFRRLVPDEDAAA